MDDHITHNIFNSGIKIKSIKSSILVPISILSSNYIYFHPKYFYSAVTSQHPGFAIFHHHTTLCTPLGKVKNVHNSYVFCMFRNYLSSGGTDDDGFPRTPASCSPNSFTDSARFSAPRVCRRKKNSKQIIYIFLCKIAQQCSRIRPHSRRSLIYVI